jgi:hypothetical protein
VADQLFALTLDDQIRCVEREIVMRKAVYPRRVVDGKMSQEKARHELAAMQAVLETLRGVKARTA